VLIISKLKIDFTTIVHGIQKDQCIHNII